MPREVHEDADRYTIAWDDDVGAVVHTWTEFASGEEFREGCERLLAIVERRDASKLLVDTRGIQAHADADHRWIREEWVPRAFEAGVECSVMVHPDSLIAKMDVEKFMDAADDVPGCPYVTSDMAEAREWLVEQ